ncbi:transcriptional regulator, BadM/Rrf2 family [Parasphingorhabdus marina DSM 22363]|uniref:Transcriptional regulator, BadM/Rrf2 family n=1 Tax=Parasphingorhabdus marina DSM 22363 TaxID=1123272 RepID=A0A1N6CRZ3_9SPHN|nr:Rrf2 family transcriptional regulator [Parasphingorhabdus marina]SIN61321.1 transcriptional regulator, BadM/Rrf2 family [Parasphingorhabdus marina DSM 22363]
MKLTAQTDYALRMLMFLTTQEGSQKIDNIARTYGISKNHLMKVAQRLVSAGFVVSQRGRGGGLTLARDPGEINVGAVVRAMETTDQFVECQMRSDNSCILTPVCGLKPVLADAVEAFLSHLDKFTLADISRNRRDFARIFDLQNT